MMKTEVKRKKKRLCFLYLIYRFLFAPLTSLMDQTDCFNKYINVKIIFGGALICLIAVLI